MSDDDLDALSELLERATKLGLLSEAAVDRLTDAIALGECSEEEVTLRVTWKLQHPSELPLDCDAMAQLAGCLALDGHFAFALACRQFNAARLALKVSKLRTRGRASLQSDAVRTWAVANGCPSVLGFPCWAEARALTGAADLNGRVCLILGPPNEKGRFPVEFDTGWGSVEPRIMPEKGTPSHAMPVDLTEQERKSVRLANLRILDDDELQRAVRILCKAELACAHRRRIWDTTQLHKTDEGVPGHDDVGLLPTWLPKRHSAVLFMRAWELGGQAGQEAIERAVNNGHRNPFSRRNCGTGGFFDALNRGLGFEKDGMTVQAQGYLHKASTFMSPLMALVGKHIFLQSVDVAQRVDEYRRNHGSIGGLDNPCVTHLMCAPDAPRVSDSPAWLHDPGSVVAFMTEQDLTPRDIEVAWRFAHKMDPERFESHDAFLAGFTPEKYDKHVRICNVRDEAMSRVSIGADGTLVIDETGW